MGANMTIRIGEVIAVNGVKVTLRIFEESNKDAISFEGNKYRGFSVREYITIQRGDRHIICLIENEYLEETKAQQSGEKTPLYPQGRCQTYRVLRG